MGMCGSKLSPEQEAELRRTREIDKRNMEDEQSEARKIKLLLLGSGESGKSTIFKQMKILYGVGFTEEDCRGKTPVIYSNTITSMKTLVEAAEVMGFRIEASSVANRFMDVADDAVIDADVGTMIKTLWKDAGILRAYENRASFQLNDSADYYFDNIDRLMVPGYVATVNDILRSRVRTSGIITEEYIIDDVIFVMYDVGGQRNERRKWIHCFDNVVAIIYVAAISEYDQVLYEDSTQNRVLEAVKLFEEICNSPLFEETSIILFLNKRDLYERKIKKVDIRQPPSEDYPEGLFTDYESGICTCGYGYPSDRECECGVQRAGEEYLLTKFLERNENPDKPIFHHVTCATDTSNIKHVFNACKSTILRRNLEGSGFMT